MGRTSFARFMSVFSPMYACMGSRIISRAPVCTMAFSIRSSDRESNHCAGQPRRRCCAFFSRQQFYGFGKALSEKLHAHLPEGVKTLPISAWEKEYTALKAQREVEYDTLKDTRAEVAELQKIRKCVDITLRADQPEQTQNRAKRHEQER